MASQTLTSVEMWRIIPSRYPVGNNRHRAANPSEVDDSLAIEALINDRVREVQGQIARVFPQARVSGPNATRVM